MEQDQNEKGEGNRSRGGREWWKRVKLSWQREVNKKWGASLKM
jgi:hypothetical protein